MTDQVGEQRSKITPIYANDHDVKADLFCAAITVTLIRSAIVVGFFLAWEFASGQMDRTVSNQQPQPYFYVSVQPVSTRVICFSTPG